MFLGFFRKLFATHNPASAVRREPPPNAQPLFHIRYQEDFGAMTRRDVFPVRMYATEEGIRAWCYLMGEMRLFKFSQMHAVHDNVAGRDIKVRGLWEWCGFPETDVAFPDESPDALKQTQWQKKPDAPRFELTLSVRGGGVSKVLFSPKAWCTNRKELGGVSCPDGQLSYVPFVHVASAVDLETGEVLSRIELWRLVLAHRDDDVPWYVVWADQHLMVICLILFARQELKKFTAGMHQQANAALVNAGYESLDADAFKAMAQAANSGYEGCSSLAGMVSLLTDDERLCCLAFAQNILREKGADVLAANVCFDKPKHP